MSDEERQLALMDAERLLSVSLIDEQQGLAESAHEARCRALEIYTAHGHREGESRALAHLGSGCMHHGQYDQAFSYFNRALGIAEDVGDEDMQGACAGNIGMIHQIQGRPQRAAACFENALTLHRRTGNRRFRGLVLGWLGRLYQAEGRLADAHALVSEALEIHTEVGDQAKMAATLGNIGTLHVSGGDPALGLESFRRALQMLRQLSVPKTKAIVYGNMGDALAALGQDSEAEEVYRKSIAISDDVLPSAAGAFRGALGLLLARGGRREEATALFDEGEALVAMLPDEHVKFLCRRGEFYILVGDVGGAREALQEAESIAVNLRLSDHGELARALRDLSVRIEAHT